MCQHEEAYVLLQIRAQSIIDSPEILNTHGIAKPTLPHVTYQMIALWLLRWMKWLLEVVDEHV